MGYVPINTLIYVVATLTLAALFIFWMLKKIKNKNTAPIQQTWAKEEKAINDHWNAQEGDWDGYNIRKRNQEIKIERLQQFENELFKATVPILYKNFPELENLDSKGYAQLKHLLSQQTEQLHTQIQNLKTKHLQKN